MDLLFLILEILKILKNIINKNTLMSSFSYVVFSLLSKFGFQFGEAPKGIHINLDISLAKSRRVYILIWISV